MRYGRRGFLKQAATAAVGSGVISCATSHRQGKRRPNVIFAFSDEHRWHSMSFTEMPGVRTPNMARLAGEGVRFTHCISNYPVCSPYRAMLMTGRWPYQQGVIDNGIPLRDEEATLGEVFRAAGYATGYVGKWHLGGVRAEPHGFDFSSIWTNDNNHWRSDYHPKEGPPIHAEGYNATLMTDQALGFVEQHRRDPFFLMLSWNPPHSNFVDAPKDRKAHYPEGTLPWRDNVPDDIRGGQREKGDVVSAIGWRQYQGYHAHIEAIDNELGRVLQRVESLGLAEDTIVIYTADHGSMMGSHGLGGKRQPYEESIRVPFLVRWPRAVQGGRSCEAMLGAIDIMPTLCSLAGVDVPASCVGQDLSGHVLPGRGPEPSEQLLMHICKENASGGKNHPAPLFRGLRTTQYTYCVREGGPWLLFDNRKDPLQNRNLIVEPSLGGIREGLHVRLQDALRKAADPFQLPKPA